ncbi:MAG: hypothetical protein CSA84_06360 [Actinomycetales bacterium]|nr:MAG: hypothetical protein CSA84_06360 [Actinomycetales bacterium]
MSAALGRDEDGDMTKNPDAGTPAPEPGAGLDAFFDGLRGLGAVRSREDRVVAGVCAGLARWWGVNPAFVRAAAIVFFLISTLGLLTYMVALALLPDEDGKILAESAIRRGDGNGIALLVVIGVLVVGEISATWWAWLGVPLAVLAWWMIRSAASGKTPRQMREEAAALGADLRRSTRLNPAPESPGSSTPQDSPVGPPPPTGPPGTDLAGVTDSPYPDRPRPAAAPSSGSMPSSGAAPLGLGPGRTYSPTRVRDPEPMPPARRRAGPLFFFVTMGLALTVYGLVMSVPALRELTSHRHAFALACSAVVASLALLWAGLRGLRAAFTATVVAVLLGMSVLAGFVPQLSTFIAAGIGERTWTPVAGQDDPAYALSMGEATLDLASLPNDGAGQVISASVLLGELNVLIPPGLNVLVESDLGAGELSAEPPAGGKSRTLAAGTAGGMVVAVGDPAGAPDAIVRLSVGLGEIALKTSSPVNSRPSTDPSPTGTTNKPGQTR